MTKLGKKLKAAVTEKSKPPKVETHDLRGFLEIDQSGRKQMFCPGCGVKQKVPKDEAAASCPNCGLNLFIKGMDLVIWWNT